MFQSRFKYLVCQFIACSTLLRRLVSHVFHHWFTALRKLSFHFHHTAYTVQIICS